MPGAEDGRCECRQGNQTVKHILLECRLLARQRRNLWTEEATRARKERGKNLDIERILTDGTCAKKAAMFLKKTELTGRSMAPLMEGNQYNTCIRTGKTSSRFFKSGGDRGRCAGGYPHHSANCTLNRILGLAAAPDDPFCSCIAYPYRVGRGA